MDTAGLAAVASTQQSANLTAQAGTSVLKKVLDTQQANIQALFQSLPQVPDANTGAGSILDVRA